MDRKHCAEGYVSTYVSCSHSSLCAQSAKTKTTEWKVSCLIGHLSLSLDETDLGTVTRLPYLVSIAIRHCASV
jgi:hypothetical protein